MLVSASMNDLLSAQEDIDKLKAEKPEVHKKFTNIVYLTRQLQFNYQYMGCLLMDEESGDFCPGHQTDYVVNVYHNEIQKLKSNSKIEPVKQLLTEYKEMGYGNLCKLLIGENPRMLVGPKVV
ncbi:hypothetical protein [Jeotgalibacillus proteolyticus]|uniref:Uncharacterized protein n=1 Tax=Jeotgalibacillus proteolyticus TaxID=2082395 RepID=A0A2S5GDL5_9BACL|nr:hypothetical protein [Jeotgalibacillus proteolyticus]PPA71079.1 hypothetical protein C4B60_09905 [Jeotgalibacillus proteolyticus]